MLSRNRTIYSACTNRGQLLREILVALMMVLVFSQPGYAVAEGTGNYIRVAPGGTNTGSCGSESAPCASIQYAVNKAVSGDVILVAEGTFSYDGSHDPCPFLETSAVVCFVDKHLTILGGYSAGNWSGADPDRRPTVIDAQGADVHRGVAIVAYNSTARLHMEGFTIQNGRAYGTPSSNDFFASAFGGGMWAQNSSVTLKNVAFRDNQAVGAQACNDCAHGGAGSGGGLAIQSPADGASSYLEHVSFENNAAYGGNGSQRGGLAVGGGLFTYQAAVSGNYVTFSNNLARAGSSSGNGTADNLQADALGGGAAFQLGSVATFTHLRATGNRAIGGDAGAFAGSKGGGGFGGAIQAEGAELTLRDSQLHDNSAQGGSGYDGGVGFSGALESFNSNTTLDRVGIVANAARSGSTNVEGGNAGSPGGGGAYLADFQRSHRGRIVNSVLADNVSVMGAGGSANGGGGGGLVIQGMEVDIEHSTFAQNHFEGDVKSGQAILAMGTGGDSGYPATVDIDYSIVAHHVNDATAYTSALTVMEGSTAHLQRLLFAGNTNDTNIDARPLPPGAIYGLDSVTTADDAGFVSMGSPDYDYHLSKASPAVDQAVDSASTIDFEGQVRPWGVHSDIGADEYRTAQLEVTPSSLTVIVDKSSERCYDVLLTVPGAADAAQWTATSTESWLTFGGSGVYETSGETGDSLPICIESRRVDLGEYNTSIQITSPDAEPVALDVSLLKVDEVHEAYLPMTIR